MLTVVGVVLHWVFPTAQIPIWAAVPSLFLALLIFGRELFDGTYHLVNALESEGWTSKDLRRWLGRDWHVVDWISFEFCEVDQEDLLEYLQKHIERGRLEELLDHLKIELSPLAFGSGEDPDAPRSIG